MQTLEDMRLWIEAIINSSDDAIISKDLNNIIVSWNKGAEALYGYTESEVIGKPIAIIIPEDKQSDIPMTAELIENRKHLHHMETIRITKDGRRIDVLITVSPIFNSEGTLIGSSAIARDISERKKSEEILHRSEERYRKIVELSPDTILIIQDGKIVFVNQAAVKLFAAENNEQLINKDVWSLFTPDRHGIIRAHNQTMKATGQAISNIEHTVIRLDGKLISAETSSCPIIFEDKPAIYIIIRDITERKKVKIFLETDYIISKNLAQSARFADGINEALKNLCHMLKFDVGRVWLLKENENILECISTWANEENSDDMINNLKNQSTLKMDEGVAGITWANNDIYWLDTTHTAPSTDADDNEFKLEIGIPISNAGKIIGILELLNSKFINKDNDLIQALISISNKIGVFIEHKLATNEIVLLQKHDLTTGLSNRSLFKETLTFEIYRAKSKNKRLAMLLIDIENFSNLSEVIDLDAGDQILLNIAKYLTILSSDADSVARYGDDQFAVIIEDFHKLDEISQFIDKLNVVIDEDLTVQGQKVNIQLNVGVGLFPEDGDTTQGIIKSASIALNKAKLTGGGTLQFCTSDMSNLSNNRILLENGLRKALDKNEFLLYYQPIVDTNTMQVAGFESLIRWSKDGKTIPPSDFISILEETKLIVPVGEWILNTACAQCKIWNEELQRPIFISINISPVQFKHSNIYETLMQTLKNSAIDPACVKVEITESAIMNDIQKSIRMLNKIKELGVKIAIDDFGTGYSSLNYLRLLPIDYLKIDRSFVTNIINNLNDAAIVRTIIGLANNLGFKVIAEGIETEEQMKYLNNLGCHEIQGYFFSRPLPAIEADEFLKQSKLI